VIVARIAFFFAVAITVVSCGDPTKNSTIHFWHFWSEPSQRRVLDSLVTVYLSTHPELSIELTELSWSDGKAKLQMAYNAGSQPDVVHLGMDWFTEFSRANVFTSTKAIPWLVNARALVVNPRAIRFSMGLCATDAHNVIKRMLPLIWSNGAPLFYKTLPISSTFDSTLVNALWSITKLVEKGGLVERARQLDDHLLNDQLQKTYTGVWIIDMARKRGIHHLVIEQTPSILNGDVLAISRSSSYQREALEFVTWLRSYEQARVFALGVSDAGFPFDLDRARNDAAFTKDPMTISFLSVARIASPLPDGEHMLLVEPIVEDMIVRCYDAKSRQDIVSIVRNAYDQVREAER